MAGRCGCSSAALTGAALSAVAPITASGAGSPASPFVVGMASGNLPLKVCTTATRPAAPALGQTIFETDDLKFRGWNGISWDQITNPGVFNIDGPPLAGTAAPPTAHFLIVTGSPDVVTNGASVASVFFPNAFPNGIFYFGLELLGGYNRHSLSNAFLSHVDINIEGALNGQHWAISYFAFGW